MTTQQLPERPNLEQLKGQAKDLLRSAQQKEPTALARMQALPAFTKKTEEERARLALRLHDAQSVIAREYGFNSWNALRERVEELTLQFDEAVTEFVQAATDGRTTRAERLLALYPRIAHANLHAALVLGKVESVLAALKDNPGLALQRGGPREWEPLLYVCHSSLAHSQAANRDEFAQIARRLLTLGADPNTRYPWLHHRVQRAALWGATCVTRLLPLAQALLEAGANPNDGVTLTLAASGGNLPVLELLLAHGADVNFPWATDGSSPLCAMLEWSADAKGALWLLEHRADPNRVCGAAQETALHVAARRWDVKLVEALVHHGADIAARRGDGRTAYVLAELNGNDAIAEWLLTHHAPREISEVDRFVGACSRGDRTTAEAMFAARPGLRAEITTEHHAALRRAAEHDDTRALETMLACGFDVNAGDEIGSTALHRAAMAGRPEAVRLLLAHGASVTLRDREFHAQPLVWAAEGSRNSDGLRDYAKVARLLIDAGSPTDWQAGEEPAEAMLEILAEWQRPQT